MKLYTTVFLAALSFNLIAQNCTPWFPFNEGTSFAYTFYNKKDKQTGRVHYQIADVEEEDETYRATVNAEIFDKKDESLYDYDFTVSCTDGKYIADFSNFINPTMKEAFGNVEVSTSGDDLVIPRELSVGLELSDATTQMETTFGAIGMKAEMNFTDRKVVDKVDVETPVQTFSAYKITGKESIHMTVINREYEVAHFYAEGFGMVKSEVYNKKGKLDSYMVLSAFSE